jgi:hypothetical protein
MFTLLKRQKGFPLVIPPDQTTLIEGVFQMPVPRARIAPTGVEFNFQISRDPSISSYEIKLVETTTSFSIHMTKVEMIIPIEHFDVPEPSERLDQHQVSDACTICMAELEEGDLEQMLPCNHTFHRHCISYWLGRAKKCPNCNRQVGFRPVSGSSAVLLLRTPSDS